MVKPGLPVPPFHFSRHPENCQIATIGEIMSSATFGQAVRTALIGELEQLHREITQVIAALNDQQLWLRPLAESNSVGHLVLHLTGNLNYFVGAQLGKSGYVRDREREFTETAPPPRTAMLSGFADAVATFRRVVSALTDDQMLAPHPFEKFGSVINTLVHLVAHFALHRGQISYIRRLVEKS
jgi:uncharacterized damage-inducible protein DinB